jgi:DNA-binding MarR family transcriptional regulator
MPEIPPAAAVSADVTEIEQALTRISYLTSRIRNHERLMALAGVPLDRAAVALLRQIADSGPVRPGELAVRLGVADSHVTRQAQQLEKAGYVTRVPDPDDHRAQRVLLTPVGQDAVDRIREASYRGMQMALAHWSPQDLRQLATLFQRMVGDLIASAEDEDPSA